MSPIEPPAPDCFGSVRHAACFWPVASMLVGQPVLRILGLHDADLAELAVLRPSRAPAGPSDSRCSCGSARTPCRSSRPIAASFLASASVEVSGLSQMTWMPASRNALAGRKVHVVRRDDGDRLDAVLALGLGLRHLLRRAVAALGIEAELGGRGLGARRIGRQRAGDQLELAVDAARRCGARRR